MSSLQSPRRDPTVSQYLRELRTIPPLSATFATEDAFGKDEDLSLFANSEFFDFDLDHTTDYQPASGISISETTTAGSPIRPEDQDAMATLMADDFAGLDFISGGDFDLESLDQISLPSVIGVFPDNIGKLENVQPSSPYPYTTIFHQQHQHHVNYAGSVSSREGQVRIIAEPATQSLPVNLQEVAKKAADEDKRRRNTAASARFRIKKKEHEQALERSAKEMDKKVTSLEGRITQLEIENRWLRDLILEHSECDVDTAPLGEKYAAGAQLRSVEAKAKKETDKEKNKREARGKGP